MRSKRVPDRVHVVRPLENESRSSVDGRTTEIVRMLAQISDKLKRSEAERYELLNELREYRKSLRDLEDKSDNSEKAYLALENKIQSKGNVDIEALQRQARFEKMLKSAEDKMVKTIAGQALIDKRLSDTESKQTMIDQRLDQSVTEQTRISRQIEITSQDKSRLMRKMERLEEMVTDTQDTLKAKAMVLLTDQSTAAHSNGLKAPAWSAGSPRQAVENKSNLSWWQRAANVQTVGMVSIVVAALLAGWAINQVQKPEVPQLAVLENGGLARLNVENNRWEPVLQDETMISEEASQIAPQAGVESTTESLATPVEDTPNIAEAVLDQIKSEEAQEATQDNLGTQEVVVTPDETPGNVLDYNDDQLLAALNSNPEKLAGQLNEIAPSSANANALAIEAPLPSAVSDPKISEPMRNFENIAFTQDAKIQKSVLAEKDNVPLSSRINADSSLPDTVKSIENQAFAANAEAQHDLAAIYTAGHGGVEQNFEKAAFWFREASDNGIANARYNLGVLYHQGLGEDRDLGRALYWYREAAKLNHAEAQYNLGIAHIEGIGTNYDPRLAAAYFERAANNGVMEAAYNLGLIYENGLLGEAKPDEALLWYKIASDQGSPEAKTAMSDLAKSLQIGMSDVDNLVERMQQINESVKGRRAGPAGLTNNSAASAPVNSINTEQALVAQVQEYLMLTGSYTGPADGIVGPKTEEAIKIYQAANDLPVDGQITRQLLNSMVGGAIEKLNR